VGVAVERRGRARLWIVAAVVLAAIGFLVFQGLGNATLYFYQADEAVERKEELGEKRFRLEGVVVRDTVQQDGNGVEFAVVNNDVTVDVVHEGDPPELFQPDIPVVLEGRWDGNHFSSDRIMVRHSEEYKAENSDRLTTATTATAGE
jgi:cytochrome c-type biogenesis protein CcmE